MKPLAARPITIALTILAPLLAHCANAKPDAPAHHSPKILEPVELLEVIKPDAKPLPPGTYKLAREWVGTLTTIGDEYSKKGLKTEAPEPVRFNLLIVSKKAYRSAQVEKPKAA